MRYGTQVLFHFFAGKADAGISNGEGAGCRICGDPDGRFRFGVKNVPICEHLEIHPGERIRRVGNQFAEKYLAIGVQGVDKNIQ